LSNRRKRRPQETKRRTSTGNHNPNHIFAVSPFFHASFPLRRLTPSIT
jgi:hypothetical protein